MIAESFERIHRSNLVGMGVLPLQFKDGTDRKSLGLTGKETIGIHGLSGVELRPRMPLTLEITREDPRSRRSRCSAASTPSTRSSTSRPAASSTTCCASCWPADLGVL